MKTLKTTAALGKRQASGATWTVMKSLAGEQLATQYRNVGLAGPRNVQQLRTRTSRIELHGAAELFSFTRTPGALLYYSRALRPATLCPRSYDNADAKLPESLHSPAMGHHGSLAQRAPAHALSWDRRPRPSLPFPSLLLLPSRLTT